MALCKTCCQSLLSISMCWDWFCIASFAILWMSTAWLSYSKVLIEISSSFQDFTNFIIFLHFQQTCTVIVYVSDKGQTSVVVYTVTHGLKTLLNSTSWTLIIMTIYDIPHAHGCTCNCMNCLFIKIVTNFCLSVFQDTTLNAKFHIRHFHIAPQFMLSDPGRGGNTEGT